MKTFLALRAVGASLVLAAGAASAAYVSGPAPTHASTHASPAVTPNFTYMQFYRYGPDEVKDGYKLGGIHADHAARFPGGRGEGITIVSQEPGAWYAGHADLPPSVRNFGEYRLDGQASKSVGIMAAIDNGFGVTGIASHARLAHASPSLDNLAKLKTYLKPGDVLQIGLQADVGPVAGCRSSCFLPMETLPGWFDAIKDLTDNGVIVVEAAGNGDIDLDHPDFDGRFDRTRRDSGAIMVGSLCAQDATRASFSNHGQRIDSSSWGCGDVATTTDRAEGADLWSENDNWYTASHGNHSANPIVAAAAASLSGYAKAKGVALRSIDARVLLTTTGTPLADGERIGTQPDLKKAFTEVDDCLGASGR